MVEPSIPNLNITPIRVPLSKEDIEAYIRFKILDSIAYPGTYKKFMLARKDQGLEWAILMTQHIHNVQHAMKDLELKEQALKNSSLSNLHIVWQHVAESNLPPVDLQLTIANCMVSHKTNIPCVIIKGKGRGAHPFTINSKFVAFLYDVWIVHKLDILIKTFARQKLEEIDPEQSIPMSDIVKAFETNKAEDIKHLANAFFLAFSHVYRSTVYGLQMEI